MVKHIDHGGSVGTHLQRRMQHTTPPEALVHSGLRLAEPLKDPPPKGVELVRASLSSPRRTDATLYV